MVVCAAGIVIIPGAPLGVITTGVQALAGVLLPSATVFLLLLCNDRDVLGPWVNRPWLNVVAGVIVSVLLMMSFVLMITTLFTTINVNDLALVLGGHPGRRLRGGAGYLGRLPAPPAGRAGRVDGAASQLAHATPEPAQPPQVVTRAGSSACGRCAATWSSPSLLLLVKAIRIG